MNKFTHIENVFTLLYARVEANFALGIWFRGGIAAHRPIALKF